MKNNSKYDIKLTFCPKYQREPLPPEHTFAEYNNDGLFYTSAFVLGVEKKSIAKNLQREMLDHQKLIKENCEKYNQIVRNWLFFRFFPDPTQNTPHAPSAAKHIKTIIRTSSPTNTAKKLSLVPTMNTSSSYASFSSICGTDVPKRLTSTPWRKCKEARPNPKRKEAMT